jgi:hypothetical protein
MKTPTFTTNPPNDLRDRARLLQTGSCADAPRVVLDRKAGDDGPERLTVLGVVRVQHA